MKPIVTFRTGAALAADYICVSGSIDGFDPNEPYTRVIAYDEKGSQLWIFYEEEYKVVAIQTWKDPVEGFEVFITMSDEGDIVFADTNPTIEKIPGAGVFAADAKGWGYMSAFRQIDGLLYAVGGAGQIYKRCAPGQWEHIDEDILQLPSVKDRLLLTDINGSHANDIYVCGDAPGAYGLEGRLYHWNGVHWRPVAVPTTERLTSIYLHKSGELWICGANGTLLRGDCIGGFRDVSTVDDNQLFYSLTSFNDNIYLASNLGLFCFDGNAIREVMTDLVPPLEDTHVVQTIDDVLWSIGFKDIARFNGVSWTRIAHPDNPPIG